MSRIRFSTCACTDTDEQPPSGDWLGRDRALAVHAGDHLALLSARAYGMSMASNYNTRGRAAEVMVSGSEAWLIRDRETPAELFRSKHLLP